MKDNFEEVSMDIIDLITNLHYEDREKEIIKFKIAYVIAKMLQDEKTFNEDTETLDKQRRR